MSREKALELAAAGREETLALYLEELRIPSISALSRHAADCRRNAEWLRERFAAAGLQAELIEGDGHPTVYAEWSGAPGAPTLLIYGHYDVQPPDPLELWQSPPFEPRLADGWVYARGATDSKGNHFSALRAAQFALQAGGPPVNLKFTIEGEEEGGGKVLPAFLKAEGGGRLRSDCVVILDGGFARPDAPDLTTGLRGIIYTEIEVTGPGWDLHSGSYGGVAPNPFNAAGHIIAGLKDRNGRVLIPGFYDRVQPPDPRELESWQQLGIDEAQLLRQTGAPALEGEPGYSLLERRWARPTLDIHGIRGGFTDEGTKTVIPAGCVIKCSMRLVADQDPQEVFDAYRRHVESLATPGTRVEVRLIGELAPPVTMTVDHPGARAFARAFETVYGHPCAYTRTGGSVPVSVDFARHLGAPMVATGFSLPGGGAHSPNEKFKLTQLERGVDSLIHVFWNLAEEAR